MVLEEATNPSSSSPDPFSSDSQPSSDIDRYAAADPNNPTYHPTRPSSYLAINDPGPDQIYVNLQTLPHRWTLLGTATTHPEALTRGIRDASRLSSSVLQRPLHQDEADALAYHLANGLRAGSFGTPLGLAAGFAQAWRRSREFRFPGWTPSAEKFNPEIFGPLKGPAARWAWHTLRFNAYGACGLVVGQIFFGSYALSLSMAGRARDPRLQELNAEIQKRMRERRGGLMGEKEAAERMPGAGKGEETFEMARQRQGVQEGGWKGRRNRGTGEEGSMSGLVDDASPTDDAFQREDRVGVTDSGLISDAQIQQQQAARQRTEARQNAAEASSASFSGNADRGSRSGRRVDDASPTATSEGASQPAGGAWARLRQQAVSAAPSSKGSSGSPAGRSAADRVEENRNTQDGFSFSRNDEDRQLAREESQRQFDARLEREREGKDFEEQSSSQRRW